MFTEANEAGSFAAAAALAPAAVALAAAGAARRGARVLERWVYGW